MNTRCDPRFARALRSFAAAASLMAAAIGVCVMLGWVLDNRLLRTALTLGSMHPITVLGMFCLGLSLWLQLRAPSEGRMVRWAKGLALVAAGAGGVALVAERLGWGSALDRFLFRGPLQTILPPAATAPNSDLCILLLGIALILLGSWSPALQRTSQVLALVSMVLAFFPAVGHLFNVASFTRLRADVMSMALSSALGFLLLASGLLASHPDRGFMSLLCSNGLGGMLLRRLLPAMVLAPILIGLSALLWRESLGFEPPFGLAVTVTGMVVFTLSLLWRNSGVLDKVEAALVASEEKLRTLIDASPDLILIRDREGIYLLANPAFAKMVGRPVGEILGRRDSEIFDAETASRIREYDQKVLTSEAPVSYEIAIRTPQGDDRVYDSSKYPYYTSEGELIGVMVISRDVTERKQIEEALKLSEQRTRTVLENSPVFLFNVDREGRVLLAKGKGLESLALRPTELAGHEITEAFQAFPAFSEAYRRALAGESFRASLDVEETSFDVWFTPLRGDEGDQILGVIGVATDVSERKRLEAQLRAQYEKLKELDKLKGDFVNAVSHDLRTPLTSILGYAEFLEDGIGGPLSEQQQSFVAQIEKSSKRLEGMVNDLLDFARLDAGTFRLHCEEGDLVSRVRDLVESMRPQAAEQRLELLTELPEGPIMRVLDPQRIDRVVANLIGNALKFTPEGGRVTVRLTEDDAGALCEVEDTGIGIAPEDLPKLFQRFTQLAAGARMKAGTGLGLSISKAQVEAHGGTVGVRSEPGKGSTFWFRLPRGVPDKCRVEFPPPA